jgi:hypothetical protein
MTRLCRSRTRLEVIVLSSLPKDAWGCLLPVPVVRVHQNHRGAAGEREQLAQQALKGPPLLALQLRLPPRLRVVVGCKLDENDVDAAREVPAKARTR